MERVGKRRRWWPTVAWVWLAMGTGLAGCDGGDLKHPPDHLVGQWQTETGPYAEDTLEILSDRIIFRSKDDTGQVYTISSVREGVEQGRVTYSILYHGADLEPQELMLDYQPAGNGVVIFRHQPQLKWTKQRRHM